MAEKSTLSRKQHPKPVNKTVKTAARPSFFLVWKLARINVINHVTNMTPSTSREHHVCVDHVGARDVCVSRQFQSRKKTMLLLLRLVSDRSAGSECCLLLECTPLCNHLTRVNGNLCEHGTWNYRLQDRQRCMLPLWMTQRRLYHHSARLELHPTSTELFKSVCDELSLLALQMAGTVATTTSLRTHFISFQIRYGHCTVKVNFFLLKPRPSWLHNYWFTIKAVKK